MTSAFLQHVLPIPRTSAGSRVPRVFPIHRLLAIALAAASLGCSDEGPTAVSGPVREARGAKQVALRDPEINQSDTYFAVQLTTSSDQQPDANMAMAGTMYSPESYAAPWSNSYVEVGYDAAGQFRFNVYRGPSADPMIPSPPSLVRVAGGSVLTYNQQGTLTQQRPFYEYFDWAGLPGGATTYATPIYVWGCDYDTHGNCESAASGAEPTALASRGEQNRARQIGDTLLEVRTPLLPEGGETLASATNGRRIVGAEVVRRFKRANIPMKGAVGEAKAGRRWLLHTHSFRTIYARDGRNDTAVTTVSFRYVAMHLDEPRQRERERAQPAKPVRDGGSSASAVVTAPAVTAAAAGPCPQIRTGPRGANYTGRLVWQHGWMSNSDTWCRMRDSVLKAFRVGYDQAYTTPWDQGMATQADSLARALMQFSPQSPNVVVGHSQGGLIARSLGQRYPNLVSGVITIGTPHLGAHVASFSRSTLQGMLSEALMDGCNGDAMCTLIDLLSGQIASGLLTLGLSDYLPAANDLYIGAPFIDGLNRTYEPFRRASIQVDVPPRWAVFRLIGDATSNPSYLDDLDGEARAGLAQTVYEASHTMLALSLSARWWTDDYGPGIRCSDHYYRNYWPPCAQPMSYQSTFWAREVWDLVVGYLQLFAYVMVNVMDRIDERWTYLTTGYYDRARGDAFIQYSSQLYPSVPGAFTPVRFLAGSRPSHVGETSSLDVFERLALILPGMGVGSVRTSVLR